MSLKNFAKNLQTVTCTQDSNVSEIAKLMKSKNIGTVLVTDKNKPKGIVTDRDLAIRCLTNGVDCSKIRAKDVMSSPVKTIKDSASILDLIDEMSAKKVRRICVVNETGAPLGIVSMADIYELLSYEIGQLANALGKRNQKLFKRSSQVRSVA